jgi:hypothetical protein
MLKTKRARLFLIFLPILACGFCAYQVWHYLSTAPWGMFGGDCLEMSSYGSVTITGTVHDGSGNPVEGVSLRVSKGEGACPQSDAFDTSVTTDADGSFLTGGWVMLGDPGVVIEIVPTGYGSCRFEYRAANYRTTTLQLDITLAETMEIEGHQVVTYEMILDGLQVTQESIREVETCS